MRRIEGFVLCCAVILPLLFVGCGGGAPARPAGQPVSGTITWEGSPLQSGEVEITPDAEMDNTGPTAIVQVSDGKYATKEGAGITKGYANVRITIYGEEMGGEGEVPEEERGAKEIVGIAIERIEVGDGGGTFDFDLTKSDLRRESE